MICWSLIAISILFFFLKSFYTFASNFEIEAKRNAFYGLVLKLHSKLILPQVLLSVQLDFIRRSLSVQYQLLDQVKSSNFVRPNCSFVGNEPVINIDVGRRKRKRR